jgi:hypothetical protein
MLDTKMDTNNKKLAESLKGSFAAMTEQIGAEGTKVGIEGARQIVTTGKPVTAESIAKSLGMTEERVQQILLRLSNLGLAFRDDNGVVLSMWGVVAPDTHVPVSDHQIRIGKGPATYTWCAIDALYFAFMLDTTLDISSVDPVTKEKISLTLSPDGTITGLSPAGAALSVLIPDGPITRDIRTRVCHYVVFFAGEESGREWANKQGQTFKLLTIPEAAQWIKENSKKVFGVF